MVYLEKFILPDEEEEYSIARKRMEENGSAFGYLDNPYPCGLFTSRGLRELDFERVTVLYGGERERKEHPSQRRCGKALSETAGAFQRRRNVRALRAGVQIPHGV